MLQTAILKSLVEIGVEKQQIFFLMIIFDKAFSINILFLF